MAQPITQKRKPVSRILEIPVLAAKLFHGLQVVQGAAGPEGRGAAGYRVVLVAGATGVGVDGRGHEGADVGEEVGFCGGAGGEGVD